MAMTLQLNAALLGAGLEASRSTFDVALPLFAAHILRRPDAPAVSRLFAALHVGSGAGMAWLALRRTGSDRRSSGGSGSAGGGWAKAAPSHSLSSRWHTPRSPHFHPLPCS